MSYELGMRGFALRLLLGCTALTVGCGDDRQPGAEEPAAYDASREQGGGPGKDGGDARVDERDVLDAAEPSLDATLGSSDGSPSVDAGAADGSLALAADGGPLDDTRPTDVDLLFVVDNSGSMANKQAKLISQVPRLLQVLRSGDRCAGGREASCPFSATSVPKRLFTKVRSLHVGVVTSNAGGLDEPNTTLPALQSCQGLGDDGKLQNSVSVAVNGVIASRAEFTGFTQGDVVIAPDPSCAGLGSVPLYQDYVVGMSSTEQAAMEATFRCVLRVGVRGCPFEQTLESPWKALAPSAAGGGDLVFLNDSSGQGDRYNAGFLRTDAVLAIVLLTDEDDCSITNAGKVLFVNGGAAGTAADAQYGSLNLRCGLHYQNNDLVRATNRYLRGFRSLKPGHPERVVFAAITGVPPDAVARGASLTEILALPQMQFAEDPNDIGYPRSSCTNAAGYEPAYPPIRIVELARDFAEQGIVSSICADDYSDAIDRLVDKLSTQL